MISHMSYSHNPAQTLGFALFYRLRELHKCLSFGDLKELNISNTPTLVSLLGLDKLDKSIQLDCSNDCGTSGPLTASVVIDTI